MQTTSPAGAIQWEPADGAATDLVPDAHDPSVRHAPMMLTTVRRGVPPPAPG